MKKIGIMSMQRVLNYGSYLQAYGLKKTIENLGDYEVEFVDYEFGDPVYEANKTSFINRLLNNKNIFQFIKKKKAEKAFANVIYENQKLINIDKKNYRAKVDTLVIGSDEVFNCVQPYPVGFSKQLFGKDYEKTNVISYAASFGYTTMDLLNKYNICDEVKKLLQENFSKISVRDENSKKICDTLTSQCAEMHLDPVLISDFSDEIRNNLDNVKIDNYIIVYAYPNRFTKEEEVYIKNFAKKHNKKIISLGVYQKIADSIIPASPFEVLAYFKKADYIITDTFHGTIFSIISNNKFCTIIRKSNKNKLSHLLSKLKQSNRAISQLDDIDRLYDEPISYMETNKVIGSEKTKSVEYLKKYL